MTNVIAEFAENTFFNSAFYDFTHLFVNNIYIYMIVVISSTDPLVYITPGEVSMFAGLFNKMYEANSQQ